MILILAAVLLTVAHYHGRLPSLSPRLEIFGWVALSFALFFVVPALVIRFGFGEALSAYGLRLGESRAFSREIAAGGAFIVAAAAFASRFPALHQGVPRYRAVLDEPWLLVPLLLAWAVYSFAWEFFFRGFLLFGLGRRLGVTAVFVQLVPFVMAHYPKSEIETLGSIVAGVALGLATWRWRSMLGAWVLHWLLAASINVFVVLWR